MYVCMAVGQVRSGCWVMVLQVGPLFALEAAVTNIKLGLQAVHQVRAADRRTIHAYIHLIYLLHYFYPIIRRSICISVVFCIPSWLVHCDMVIPCVHWFKFNISALHASI